MENEEMPSEQELLSYLESLRAKDPLFNERVEFGRFLIRPIQTLSEQELIRYNELKQILNHPRRGERKRK